MVERARAAGTEGLPVTAGRRRRGALSTDAGRAATAAVRWARGTGMAPCRPARPGGTWAGPRAALPRTSLDGVAIDGPLPDDVVDGNAPDQGSSKRGDPWRAPATGRPGVALEAYRGRGWATAIEDDPAVCPGRSWPPSGGSSRTTAASAAPHPGSDGYGTRPIRGVALDGGPGIALIPDTDQRGSLDGLTPSHDRAVGPCLHHVPTWGQRGRPRRTAATGGDPRTTSSTWPGAPVCAHSAPVGSTSPGPASSPRAVRRLSPLPTSTCGWCWSLAEALQERRLRGGPRRRRGHPWGRPAWTPACSRTRGRRPRPRRLRLRRQRPGLPPPRPARPRARHPTPSPPPPHAEPGTRAGPPAPAPPRPAGL